MIIHTRSFAREGSNSASGFVNSNVDNDARRTNSATGNICKNMQGLPHSGYVFHLYAVFIQL